MKLIIDLKYKKAYVESCFVFLTKDKKGNRFKDIDKAYEYYNKKFPDRFLLINDNDFIIPMMLDKLKIKE